MTDDLIDLKPCRRDDFAGGHEVTIVEYLIQELPGIGEGKSHRAECTCGYRGGFAPTPLQAAQMHNNG